jgi:vacuolar-type H+-ATPase subunit H
MTYIINTRITYIPSGRQAETDAQRRAREEKERRNIKEAEKLFKEMEKKTKDEEKKRKKDQSKRRKEEERRKRKEIIKNKISRLSRLEAWILKKVAGTAFKVPLDALIGSTTGHLAIAITVSVVLGFALNQSLSYVSNDTLSYSHSSITCAIISLVAGAASGGAGGAFIAAIWGWLVGAIADTVATYFAHENLKGFINTVAAWIAALIIGWFVGKTSAQFYEGLTAKHGTIQSIIEKLFITIALVSIGLVLFGLIKWLFLHLAID